VRENGTAQGAQKQGGVMDSGQQQSRDLQEQEEILCRALENIYNSVPRSAEADVLMVASALGLSKYFQPQRRTA
jgi:hypothetical protein